VSQRDLPIRFFLSIKTGLISKFLPTKEELSVEKIKSLDVIEYVSQQITIQKFMQGLVSSRVKVSALEIEQEMKRIIDFNGTVEFLLSEIFVSFSNKTQDDAYDIIKSVYEKLKKGADVNKLIMLYSDSMNKNKNGENISEALVKQIWSGSTSLFEDDFEGRTDITYHQYLIDVNKDKTTFSRPLEYHKKYDDLIKGINKKEIKELSRTHIKTLELVGKDKKFIENIKSQMKTLHISFVN
jgi:uncharacterized protein (DUF2164 family)